MFEKSEWIWLNTESIADEYADFIDTFVSGEKTLLRISCDSNYTAYVNGRLAAFGQYADYPDYKIYDEVDISEFTVEGENLLAVRVWYYGENTQTYIKGEAGLFYETVTDGNISSFSGSHVLSRRSRDYISGVRHLISGQLGFSYHCDIKAQSNWHLPGGERNGFAPSRIVSGITKEMNVRPIEKLLLKDRSRSEIVTQGVFEYPETLVNTQTDMQHAFLSFRFPHEIGSGAVDFSRPFVFKAGENENIYFIVDLGAETSGFLDFDITVSDECDMEVGYGEHLKDGRCRTSIRDFTADFKLKAGRNVFLNTFRRFGCRYIQFFIHCREATVTYAGLRPTVYPVTAKKPACSGLLRNTVYEVCENTLLQCMHEHYEDCPWREQALYTMDSRNQMLCGYYCFGEYKFPRAALKLISKGLRDDGILSLCYPAGLDFPIPSFSLMYFIQMKEYIDYSKDTTLAVECFDVLETLMDTFLKKITRSGLCENFYGKDENGNYPYWNFYEWSETMSGAFASRDRALEAPLNADLSLALQSFSAICSYIGKDDDALKYKKAARRLNKAIAKYFYNEKTKLFASFDNRVQNVYSVLTNSLCLLCGAADGLDISVILEILSHNGGDIPGIRIIPNTLSMNSFRFDALLKYNRKKYAKVILDEIDRDYLYMLRNGATSFWETIVGDYDFGYAGSLCHGWSALPIYYYEILNG